MRFQILFAASHHVYLINTIWYLVIFAVLMLLIKHYAWGPVSDMMEKRRQRIINDLDSADSQRKKADILVSEREAALKNSRQEATQILSDAKSNAQKTSKEIVADANDGASSIRKKAELDAKKAKAEALTAARSQVADISVLIAEKIISKNLTAEDQKDLVDQFIKGLND